jgi:Delta7-sterol 5-desaturase
MKSLIEDENLRLVLAISSNLVRYFLFAGLAYFIFYVWKRKAWFYMKIQKRFPDNKEIFREIAYSLSTIIIFGLFAFGIFYCKIHGFTQMYNEITDFGWFYWLFSLVFLIFYHDTWFYWTHRWMHSTPKIFKIFHRVHHLSHNPTPWAAFAFHPTEAVVEVLFLPIILFIMPFHISVIILFLLWMILLNVLGHVGYEIIPKRFHQTWVGKWQNTPTHHNQHHQRSKGNYGLYFNFWDTWMNTNFENYEEEFQQNSSSSRDFNSR